MRSSCCVTCGIFTCSLKTPLNTFVFPFPRCIFIQLIPITELLSSLVTVYSSVFPHFVKAECHSTSPYILKKKHNTTKTQALCMPGNLSIHLCMPMESQSSLKQNFPKDSISTISFKNQSPTVCNFTLISHRKICFLSKIDAEGQEEGVETTGNCK